MDLGRLPTARYPGREVVLSTVEVTQADIDYVVRRIGEFGEDNRAGISTPCTASPRSATARAR
jgi:stage III sporulation protein SpoIIIAA